MELNTAVQHLGALAHDTRLAIFRQLVRRGSSGLPAGEIAGRLGIAPPNASFHLAELARVGLIASRRDGRNVIYSVDFSVMASLMDYLRDNCCAEEPEAIVPIRSITAARPRSKGARSVTSSTSN